MDRESIDEYLSTHVFFSDLDDKSKKTLAESADVLQIKQGEVLFQPGASSDKFYLLLTGQVSVRVPALMGPALEIQTLNPDQVLGWSWLIPPYRWSFQAMAVEDSELLEFDGKRILANCEEDSDFGYHLLKIFAGLMSERLDKARQKMMDQWNPPGFA